MYLFNICLEKVIRNIKITDGGTIFNRTQQCLAYADDIYLVSRTQGFLQEGFIQLEEESRRTGLKVNEEKTKNMATSGQKGRAQNIGSITVGNYNFQKITEFKYLGSLITERNKTSIEIKARIAVGSRGYYALQPLLRSKLISRALKLPLYKVVIRPTVTYASETWCLTQAAGDVLRVCERKVLRKIFGAVSENGTWRPRTNKEIADRTKSQIL
jgi:hypothetical protein